MNHVISADIATFPYFTRLNWAYLKLYKPSKTVSFKHLVQLMKKNYDPWKSMNAKKEKVSRIPETFLNSWWWFCHGWAQGNLSSAVQSLSAEDIYKTNVPYVQRNKEVLITSSGFLGQWREFCTWFLWFKYFLRMMKPWGISRDVKR